MRKKEKGVTLIALVVTIIVLIIIAGVSIGSITDQKRHYKTIRKSKWSGAKREHTRKNRSRHIYRESKKRKKFKEK